MEVKDAVKIARSFVLNVFSDEKIMDVGLEETEFDESSKTWIITIGFRRPYKRHTQRHDNSFMSMMRPNVGYDDRWYKSVVISAESGKVVSMQDRILRTAA